MQLVPYLNFNGNCREAMEFYKSVFGGQLDMQTVGDSQMKTGIPEKDNRIMHAGLKSDAINFMASDGDPRSDVNFGDSISLSINGHEDELITKYFNALAEGGKIDMPLEKQFWGDKFGMVTDKFGIHWMANISKDK